MKKYLHIILCSLTILFAVAFVGACDGNRDVSAPFETENGIRYSAENYETGTYGGFLISDGFTITFAEGQLRDTFNRLSLVYSSDRPLRVTICYNTFLKKYSDDYYLEAGDNIRFDGLISTYLKGKRGRRPTEIRFDVLSSDKADFSLHSFTTETVKVYSKKTYYIENDNYRLGVRLAWGGGINCIKDKKTDFAGISNLCNDHDTGRLIQQSYYGTAGNDEYAPDVYNGSRWVYNPVQGGDQYGNASRLIDIRITQNSIYVKAQPQDWSLNNALTPSYMENTYTLAGDTIRVDNRFTDFSGWEHPYSHQELPAFYTISYLDDFYHYDGAQPWSGDSLSIEPDLPFWGGEYHNSCIFDIDETNDETWCAWISSKINYGIGLYVPNVSTLLAGRHSFTGSKSSNAPSTNYVAPLATLQIRSFEPIEYSYLITTGSPEKIRSTFTDNRYFADNADLDKYSRSDPS